MKGCVGKIARKASEWRDRYRLGIVGLLLGSGLADDPQEQPSVPHPIKPKDGKEEEK
jgi:hypothetical protein